MQSADGREQLLYYGQVPHNIVKVTSVARKEGPDFVAAYHRATVYSSQQTPRLILAIWHLLHSRSLLAPEPKQKRSARAEQLNATVSKIAFTAAYKLLPLLLRPSDRAILLAQSLLAEDCLVILEDHLTSHHKKHGRTKPNLPPSNFYPSSPQRANPHYVFFEPNPLD